MLKTRIGSTDLRSPAVVIMAAAPKPITINLPSKYAPDKSNKTGPEGGASTPTLEWLMRAWTVTHSTLAMWRSARNVRITYTPLPAKEDGRARIDDLVEYEPTKKSGVLKSVEGIDTAAADGGWDWRGKGWLFFVGSHWELLAWGEAPLDDGQTERWAVTWFAPTVFTKEGIDVYCDKREGLSEKTYAAVMEALKKVEAKELVGMVEKDMQAVEIKLPWTEKE